MEGPTETVIVWSNLLTMTQPEIDSAVDVPLNPAHDVGFGVVPRSATVLEPDVCAEASSSVDL